MINAHKILLSKSEGKRLHGSPRHWWEDSTEVDDAKVAYCVCLDPMVDCCEYGNEALGSVEGCKHLHQVNKGSLLNRILLSLDVCCNMSW
jgi:hypothetical protein